MRMSRGRLLRRLGTTGHAVMAQNRSRSAATAATSSSSFRSRSTRRTRTRKTAADFCDKLGKPRNIAELTKERLRRAAKKIKDENPLFAGDLGFRVFKLDSSNIRAWEPDRDDLDQTLLESVEHLKTDRTEADILYELLLKLGLDLCVPIEKRTIAGKTVHAIGGGVLLACLAEKIARDEVEPLALGIVEWHKELAPAGDTHLRLPRQRLRRRRGQDQPRRHPRAARASRTCGACDEPDSHLPERGRPHEARRAP